MMTVNISDDYMIETLLRFGLISTEEVHKAYVYVVPRLKRLEQKAGLYGLTVVNKHLTYMRSQMKRYDVDHRLDYLMSATENYIQRYKQQKEEYNL